MNREEEIKRWQASIDDDLLEEAQRPLPRGSAALRWGGLAACLCAAALALELMGKLGIKGAQIGESDA